MDSWEATGLPLNLFNGVFTGPTNGNFTDSTKEVLTEEITHFKYGCILDANEYLEQNGFRVKLDVKFLQGKGFFFYLP